MKFEKLLKISDTTGLKAALTSLIDGTPSELSDEFGTYRHIENLDDGKTYDGQMKSGVFEIDGKTYMGKYYVDSYGDITDNLDQILQSIKEVSPREVTKTVYEAV